MMDSFWSWWIIILTSVFLVIQAWILFANRKTPRINQDPDDPTTGHEFDGIYELENEMPRWWFGLFVATFIFGIAYLIVYPGMGNYKGVFGWTQVGQLEERQQAADERYGAVLAEYMQYSVEELVDNERAQQTGSRLFANNCSVCHGSDARGNFGFPNLTDNDWLYGGEPDDIVATLNYGRVAAMPAWSAALGEDGIDEVTQYLLAFTDRSTNDAAVAAGEQKFGMFCAACHNADAKGNQMLGAPNLTDDIWLYGGSEGMIKHTLRSGRNGVMPKFGHSLSEEQIHLLAAYVYGLSND
ncbi:cytochrome-c oxidase, cbb3-type subunit III [uncultured Umboniibacter sp.]|uniref:cytochrome-c oxidase, cbb3-type subunit III n=1 Tax=uncultured Umboniibacter sp. TaxID=1798917 RepID=UPI00341488F6